MTARPIHRQFGSKARVANRILSLVPPGKRVWCELFAGTAAVTLAKAPHPEEHINDLNGEISNLFHVLRDSGHRQLLIDLVTFTPWSEAEFRFCLESTPVEDPVERARRYLVASWQGFSGQFAKRTGWVSFDGSSKARSRIWSELPERISIAADRLKSVCVHRKDALLLMKNVARRENAVAFLDPPYPEHTLRQARTAYAVRMMPEDHVRLAEICREANCAVIITMNPGTVYDQILMDWHKTPLPVQTLKNTQTTEVIFTNFEPSKGELFDQVKLRETA